MVVLVAYINFTLYLAAIHFVDYQFRLPKYPTVLGYEPRRLQPFDFVCPKCPLTSQTIPGPLISRTRLGSWLSLSIWVTCKKKLKKKKTRQLKLFSVICQNNKPNCYLAKSVLAGVLAGIASFDFSL